MGGHGGEQGRGSEQGCGGEQSHGGEQGYGVSRALGHSLCTEKSLDRLTLLTPGACEVSDGRPFHWACEGNITDRRCCESISLRFSTSFLGALREEHQEAGFQGVAPVLCSDVTVSLLLCFLFPHFVYLFQLSLWGQELREYFHFND